MPPGDIGNSQRLLTLARQLGEKQSEVQQLQMQIRDDFSNPEYKPFVEKILANDKFDGADIVSTISEYISRHSVIVGLCLLIALLISWLAVFLIAGDAGVGTADRLLLALGVSLFVVLAASAAALLLIGSAKSIKDFDKFWERAEKVLQSGIFYFFAGLGLLLFAIYASDHNEHPSLTFLIAMLGLAIMLFGTGSQAAGAVATAGARLPRMSEVRKTDAANGSNSGTPSDSPVGEAIAEAETSIRAVVKAVDEGLAKPTDAEKLAGLANLPNLAKAAESAVGKIRPEASQIGTSRAADWSPVKANAAIAGGAAVLTAIFGIGVIKYSPEIRGVFNDFDQYENISIEACASYAISQDGQLCDGDKDAAAGIKLDEYAIQAQNAYGSPIYARLNGRQIIILVFRNDRLGGPFVRLVAHRLVEGRDYKKDMSVSIPLEDKANASDSTASRAACSQGQSGADCRLARVVKRAGENDRTRMSWFTLNFANDPITLRSDPIDIAR
jgi:hypothetical protein